MIKRLKKYFILAILLAFFALPPSGFGQAQSESAYDLIATVNALRESQGLAHYSIDGGLMSYAQQHADYMASIQNATHTHSDGSLAWQNGIQENVAVGTQGFINTSYVVHTIWSDWIHWRTMMDYVSGSVGAGIALGADGNVYFVLNVRPGSAAGAAPVPNPTSAGGKTGTPAVIATPLPSLDPLITSTPAADGSVTHIVGNGQTLWWIADAYQIKLEDLRAINGMPAGYSMIYTGQKIMIQLPLTPAASGSPAVPIGTPTAAGIVSPSAGMTQPQVTRTATRNPSKTLTASVTPSSASIVMATRQPPAEPSEKAMGFWLIGISLLGLIAVLAGGFVSVRRVKPPQ